MDYRKEKKRQYKETFQPPGIVMVKNKVNNKLFIQPCLDINSFINRTKFELRIGKHLNRQLQADWNAFGENEFDFVVLEEIKKSEDANFDYQAALKFYLEYWLDEYQPYNEKGYH